MTRLGNRKLILVLSGYLDAEVRLARMPDPDRYLRRSVQMVLLYTRNHRLTTVASVPFSLWRLPGAQFTWWRRLWLDPLQEPCAGDAF